MSVNIPERKAKARAQGLCGNVSPCNSAICVLKANHSPVTHNDHGAGFWWCSGAEDSIVRLFEKVGTA